MKIQKVALLLCSAAIVTAGFAIQVKRGASGQSAEYKLNFGTQIVDDRDGFISALRKKAQATEHSAAALEAAGTYHAAGISVGSSSVKARIAPPRSVASLHVTQRVNSVGLNGRKNVAIALKTIAVDEATTPPRSVASLHVTQRVNSVGLNERKNLAIALKTIAVDETTATARSVAMGQQVTQRINNVGQNERKNQAIALRTIAVNPAISLNVAERRVLNDSPSLAAAY